MKMISRNIKTNTKAARDMMETNRASMQSSSFSQLITPNIIDLSVPVKAIK